MNDHEEAQSGNRVGADDATVGSLDEPGKLFQCTLRVWNVDRVVVRLQVLVSLTFWIWIIVQRFDECKVHSLSSSVLTSSSKYKASSSDGVFIFAAPEVAELLGVAFPKRRSARRNSAAPNLPLVLARL